MEVGGLMHSIVDNEFEPDQATVEVAGQKAHNLVTE